MVYSSHILFVDAVGQDERVTADRALGSRLDLHTSVLGVLNLVVVHLLGVCIVFRFRARQQNGMRFRYLLPNVRNLYYYTFY